MGMVGGGLNRYDPLAGAFSRYQYDPDDAANVMLSSLFQLSCLLYSMEQLPYCF